jgi:hypothetical protein
MHIKLVGRTLLSAAFEVEVGFGMWVLGMAV